MALGEAVTGQDADEVGSTAFEIYAAGLAADADPDQVAMLRLVAHANRVGPGHELLGRFQGDWERSGVWSVRADREALEISGTDEGRWILLGQFMELAGFELGGLLVSRVQFGFDPDADEYFAISTNALTPRYDIERGRFDEPSQTLLLCGTEYIAPLDLTVAYTRTMVFIDDETFTMEIGYPKNPDNAFGGMFQTYRRRSAIGR